MAHDPEDRDSFIPFDVDRFVDGFDDERLTSPYGDGQLEALRSSSAMSRGSAFDAGEARDAS